MKSRKSILSAAAGLLLGAAIAPAQAAFINFDSHASTGSTSGAPGAAIVTNDFASLGIVFGRAGLSAGSAVVTSPGNVPSGPNGACGLDSAGSITANCAGDQYFNFVSPSDGVTPATTNSLSFFVGDGGGDIDSWILHIYDASDTQLEARVVSNAAFLSESFFYAGMSRVWIQNTTGTTLGYLLDNIEFATPTGATAVPEPATLTLLGFGLCSFAGLRRRKQR
jgi:hypothetical protein